jgi:adenylyl-sulfate kinase
MTHAAPSRRAEILPPPAALGRDERWGARGQRGLTVWLTGLSGAGKSTIAAALEATLIRGGIDTVWLDGDTLRTGLCDDLGLSDGDRRENIRRLGEVSRLFAQAGLVTIVSAISPFRGARDAVRQRHESDRLGFVEVLIDAPLAVLSRRDTKGLYRRAAAGELKGLTGVDAPYERPERAEIEIRTDTTSVADAVSRIGRVVAVLSRLRHAPAAARTDGGEP